MNLPRLVAALENEHGSNNAQLKPSVEFIESPHHSSRNGAAITMIVVHCTEIPLKRDGGSFRQSEQQCKRGFRRI